ncbi:hypothetical protein LTR97_010705 [Elasticomyces elasticus]|uniref:Uncharacterized protein n=1 Tax=Elasticomyces elasticus TaxID=574655 RepID=A0AAN7VZS4_9PEZI|nr:hypothetical protein LTR97_010705 [Elasticomyces elasticus]
MGSTTKETVTSKLVPLFINVLPCLLSVWLVLQAPHHYGRTLTSLVSTQRTAVQILVQILSHGLGLMQVYSLRACLRFAIRLLVFRTPVRLEKLGYWAALSSGQVDITLPAKLLFMCASLVALSVLPGALWTGALTPLLEVSRLPTKASIEVPAFTQASADIWDSEFEMRHLELWNIVENCKGTGLITSCPVPALQGALLSTASSATAISGTVRRHAKIDSSDWSYLGRSYGLGSSFGLTTVQSDGTVLAVSYIEYGFAADVRCIFNTSAAYSLEFLETADGGTSVAVYAAQGYLPNSFDEGSGPGEGENYSVVSSSPDPTTSKILAWSARAIGGRNFIVVATGSKGYSQFDQAQCEVVFHPSAFNVSANITSKQIVVLPNPSVNAAVTQLSNITTTINAINSVNLLSRMSSSLYTSVLGDALARNLVSVVDPTDSANTTSNALRSLEDSFSAVLDDILGAYGAAQIILGRDTDVVSVIPTGRTTRIGDPIYIYLAAGLTGLVLLVQLVEIVRTRCWSGLVILNIFDVRSVIVAASAGGSGIANDFRSSTMSRGMHVMYNGEQSAQRWRGNADDKGLASLQVQFCQSGPSNDGPVVVAASEEIVRESWTSKRDTRIASDGESEIQLIQHRER